VFPPRLLLAARLFLAGGLLQAAALPAQTPAATKDYLALSRDLLGKYYETQKLLAKEDSDWKTGREILDSRLALLEAQLKELTEKTTEQGRTISENDTERDKLDAQNRELTTTQERLQAGLEKLETRVHGLWPRLPAFLKTKLQGQYERLPAAGMKREEVKLSSGERMVNVLVILNEVNKFHGDILVVNERRKVSGDRELEVRVIYFGLAAAYFAGSGETADVGGMLLPGAQGWEAVEDAAIAPLVNEVIAMQKGEKVAGFVSLPVRLR
jgi:vacuolar-type H+-ATPase subunit I/STV1